MASSTALKNAALAAAKTELDGGRLYVFNGPVPTSADVALDMVADHTELVEMTKDGDGSTGLTFAAPAGGLMQKAAAEVWKGTIDFDGVNSGSSSLSPTFYRFCEAGDNGRGAATTQCRIQGTCGPGTDMQWTDNTFVDNGTNERGVTIYEVRGI